MLRLRVHLLEHLQTRTTGPDKTGLHTTGRALGLTVSPPPASETLSAGLGRPGRATALQSLDSTRAAGRQPPTTTSGFRSTEAKHAGRAAARPEAARCPAPPGVEEPT